MCALKRVFLVIIQFYTKIKRFETENKFSAAISQHNEHFIWMFGRKTRK